MDPRGFPDMEQALSNEISIEGILEWTQKKVEVEESTRNHFSFWFWIKCIMPSTAHNIFDNYHYTTSFRTAFNAMQWMMHHDNRFVAFNSFTAFVHSNRSFRNCCWLRSQQFLPSSNTLQNTSGLSFSSSKNYYRKKKEHKCATQPKRNLTNLKRISVLLAPSGALIAIPTY